MLTNSSKWSIPYSIDEDTPFNVLDKDKHSDVDSTMIIEISNTIEYTLCGDLGYIVTFEFRSRSNETTVPVNIECFKQRSIANLDGVTVNKRTSKSISLL